MIEAKLNKEILDRVEARAYELLVKYRGCAQCSFFAIQDVCCLEGDLIAKASVVLSGGVAGLGSACGALTGASLALGIKYGRDISMLSGPIEEAIEQENAALEPIARLGKWFERKFGSIECRDLRKAFLGTVLSREVPWQQEWLDELGVKEYCGRLVAQTARRAAAMLENPRLTITEEL